MSYLSRPYYKVLNEDAIFLPFLSFFLLTPCMSTNLKISGREEGGYSSFAPSFISHSPSARENRLQLPDSCGSSGMNTNEVQVVREREAGREDDAIWPDWEEERDQP